MTGWKTKFGGVGLICSGVGLVLAGLVADPIDGDKLSQGLTMIFAGLGMIGIGHKIEKTKS